MKLTDIFGLLGGLGLFLYGMQMMSTGLEAAAGNRMKMILEKLTSNRFLGVAVGAGITAVIQSSSATTVMVVGFVNSGMMTLRQAVWVIMGANIGTTITGQLIALDVGVLAPVIVFAGVALVLFVKNPKIHHIGNILGGLGILFIGMQMMSDSMMPLRESAAFVGWMTNFTNPLLGILAGAIFTAVIQSSSASVGILQALAGSGLIPFSSAVYVLFGQNIGTCITALLASIGTNRNAKRTTIIHLSFNIIGTILFTTVTLLLPLTSWIAAFTPGNSVAQIANMHTLFNIVTTALLLPFGTLLARMSEHILPGSDETETTMKTLYITDKVKSGTIGSSAIYIEQVKRETERMFLIAQNNVDIAFQAFHAQNTELLADVEEQEETLDYLNKEISNYISKVLADESDPRESGILSAYYKITGNFERIGDHAMNIAGYSKRLQDYKVVLAEETRMEIIQTREIALEIMELLMGDETDRVDQLTQVSAMEQKIDDLTETYRNNMLRRMASRSCSEEESVLYSEMLTDFERIGDHALNISQEFSHIALL